MKTAKAKLSRRYFVLGIGAGAAASATGLIATKKDVGGAADDKSLEGKKGYQLTEHVRNYYRTAKI
jgi:hypothetical protein